MSRTSTAPETGAPTDVPLSAIIIAVGFGALAWTGIVEFCGWGGVPGGMHAGQIAGAVCVILIAAHRVHNQLKVTRRQLTPLTVGLDYAVEIAALCAAVSLVAAAIAATGFLMTGSFGPLLAAASLPATLFALAALGMAGVVVTCAGNFASAYFWRAVVLAIAWPLVIGGLFYVGVLSLFLVVPQALLTALAVLLGGALVFTAWALATDDAMLSDAEAHRASHLLPPKLAYVVTQQRFSDVARARHLRRLIYQIVLPPIAAIAGLYAVTTASFVATLTPPALAFIGALAGLLGVRRLATVLLTERGVVIRRRDAS